MRELVGERHALVDGDIFRVDHLRLEAVLVFPDLVVVDGELFVPRLHILEHRHGLVADHRQPAFPIRVEPRGEDVALHARGKAQVQMGKIAQMVEHGRPLAMHL